MRPLRPGKGRQRWVWPGLAGWAYLDFHTLVAHELHTGAPMLPPAPILPVQWRGTNLKRMQQHTDPTWLHGGFSVPLTLLTHRAAATIKDPGAEEHTQTAIRFAALFRGTQRLAFWTQ